jgi:hypothetical protein
VTSRDRRRGEGTRNDFSVNKMEDDNEGIA